MVNRDVLRELATAAPERPVLSIYARTDPRDPANTAETPAWDIEVRNGLRAIAERLEAGDDRDARLGFRALRERAEAGLHALTPAERARSVAWFVEADGSTTARYALHLPVRRGAVVWDRKPFVSPLVDVVDRGAPTGIVIVGREHVRLLHLEQGETGEPDAPVYELALGDWRAFGGSAGGSPARGMLTTSHQEHFEARMDEQRDRLYGVAGEATAARLSQLGWERIALVSEGQVAARFRAALPAGLLERIVIDADLNLDHAEPVAIAEALEPRLEDAWREAADRLVAAARERAAAGGHAALGPQAVLEALAEGRVDHLVLDPGHDFGPDVGVVPPTIPGPPELLGERAVEAAIATGAQVTALAAADTPALAECGGMAALLRY
ncbi:MAG TPA: VLRF1 family aeRF1-type release factor [Solirubrobacteraceae bacterium]|nr:VLRF1 family aeRF1-type release factor [Solirubrobacteraceae bacterium]